MTMTENGGTRDVRQFVIDRPEDGLFLVDRSAFTDPALLDVELERIFGGTWVYLAHESQIRKPNDFVTTHIGRIPVIVARNKAGAVRGFVNSCAHRGTVLCRTDRGNQPVLTCSYHGWCYDLDGVNVYVKDRDTGAYPTCFDRRDRNLTPLARLSSYRGFVFGSLTEDVPDLEEHLGEARAFIDMLADQSPDGLEVLRGASTYTYRGNWKLQAENGVDGYHFTTVHANYIQLVQQRAQSGKDKVKALDGKNLLQMKSGCYDLGSGHVVIWAELPNAPDRPAWERRPEYVSRFGEERAQWMVNRMRNLLLYPNVQLMDQASTQIRVFRPLSVDETEVKIYCIAPVGESAAARERRIRQYEDFFNASGMATPDDLAQFEACQAGYASRRGRASVAYDRGALHMTIGPDEEAAKLGVRPVSSGKNIQDETLFQGQYRRWVELMTRRPVASGEDELANVGKQSGGEGDRADSARGVAPRPKELVGLA